MQLTFEWDEEKAKENLRQHKVSFEEAKTVFNDPFLLTFSDPDHSEGERRYLNIGQSLTGRTLIVIHTEHQPTIRIISCRKTTPKERKAYEEGTL